MGAIGAVVGEAGDPELGVRLSRMLARSPYRGTPEVRVEHGVALGIQSLGWDASLATAWSWTVAVHGFVANWPELAAAHRLELPPGATQAALLAHSYQRLGDGLFARLRGEFSILLYDRRSRLLRAVRDVIGCRPLYAEHSGGRTYLATEMRQLRAGSGSSPSIDPDGLIQDLLGSYEDRERTHLAGVARHLPGTIISFDSGAGATGRPWRASTYWTAPDETTGRYDTDDLARRLRRVIERSVDRWLPERSFGVALSGGLDSSSLWCLISDRARRGDRRAAAGHPYSFVAPGLECDETDRIRLVHQATSTAGTLVDGSSGSLGGSLAELARDIDGLHSGSLFIMRAVARAAREDGRTALVFGVGGDEWLYGKLTYLADELRAGHAIRFASDLLQVRDGVTQSGTEMLLRFTAVTAWRRLRRRVSRPRRPAWVHASRALPAPDLTGPVARIGGGEPGSRARRALLATLLGVQDLRQRDTEEQLFALHRLEPRMPLMDLDLVELVCSIPPRSLTDARRPKHLLRLAMGDMLPEEIRDSLAVVHYESLICRDLDAIEEALPPRQWRLVEAGIADPRGLETMFENARQPGASRTMLPSLVVAEALLRHLD